jgi:BASS family bile acid:Na+ symporter
VNTVAINFSEKSLLALNAILAIILYGIALQIKREEIFSLLKNKKSALVGFLAQVFALPFVTFLMLIVLKPSAPIALGMIIVAACPGGNISNLIAFIARANVGLSVSLTAFSTLFSVVSTPFNIAFYGSRYEPVKALLQTINMSVQDMLQTFLLLLVLPIVLGFFTQSKYPKAAAVIGKFIRKISMLLLWIFIALAFASNAKAFIANAAAVFGLVFLHNSLAFGTGFLLAKLAKLPDSDVKTITIETGIQNAGLGLIIVFNFFGGNAGAAMVAAMWGVWHLISGFVLAKVFSRTTC